MGNINPTFSDKPTCEQIQARFSHDHGSTLILLFSYQIRHQSCRSSSQHVGFVQECGTHGTHVFFSFFQWIENEVPTHISYAFFCILYLKWPISTHISIYFPIFNPVLIHMNPYEVIFNPVLYNHQSPISHIIHHKASITSFEPSDEPSLLVSCRPLKVQVSMRYSMSSMERTDS